MNKLLDNVSVSELGIVEVRWLIKDIELLDDKYERATFEPGFPLEHVPEEIRPACVAAWTDEVIATWNAKVQQTLTDKNILN